MTLSQQETNQRLKSLQKEYKGERELRSLKQLIVEKDLRIKELETETKLLTKMLKNKL